MTLTIQNNINMSKQLENSMLLLQSLSSYVNDKQLGKRIILGVYAGKRAYIIFSRRNIAGKQQLTLQICTKYSKQSPESKEFVSIALHTLHSSTITEAIQTYMGNEFDRLIVDVHTAQNKRTEIAPDELAHLILAQTDEDKRAYKFERLMFNNPKLWKFKLE